MNHPSIPTQTVLDGLDHLAKGGLTTQGIFDLVFAAKAKIAELTQNDKRNLKKVEVTNKHDEVVGYLYGDSRPVEELVNSLNERYVAFCGDKRDGRGWHGYRGTWPTMERCLIEILKHEHDWWHIVDTKTMQIVELG